MELPEEKLAVRWMQRLGLKPPFDVANVLIQFADIIEDNLPVDADAILIRKGGAKPTVILQNGMTATRKTFTLAHEFGHLCIPWHTGSFVCKPESVDGSEGISQYLHIELEKEANRFAAEFLLPTAYVNELFNQFGSPIQMLGETSKSKISKLAASFKFLRCLPPNFLMFEVDDQNQVIRSGRTNRSMLSPPPVGSTWQPKSFESLGVEPTSTATSNGTLIWIDGRKVKMKPPNLTGSLTSRDIANLIFQELGERYDKKKLLQSINGVIGAANGTIQHNKSGDLYTFLCLRFRGREQLEDVVAHPRFKEFLAARAKEIEDRNG